MGVPDMDFAYDDAQIESILGFARRLENNSINSANEKNGTFAGKKRNPYRASTVDDHHDLTFSKTHQGKGRFGDVLEEKYFGKKNDNKSQPDFPNAKLELKASPLQKTKKKGFPVKERLVLNHFTYKDIDRECFDTSHFKAKNENILIVFYFYQAEVKPEEMQIELVDLWQCLKEDGAIIKQDWEKIVQKVHEGKAEDISEGDTLYLGACTKGATKATSMQEQPHSTIKAPGRALCFKQSYINHVFQVLRDRKKNRSEAHFLTEDETFEKRIQSLFSPYLEKTVSELKRELAIGDTAKNLNALIARKILGFSRKNTQFYEFEAANIQIKTIRIESNGTVRENMSFPAMVYTDIVNQEWEDSALYQELTSKFIFVFFKKTPDGSDYTLAGYRFWNMPEKDLEVVHEKVWERTKECIAKDDFGNLPKISDHQIAHVRPHARNKEDVMLTPSGRYEYKRCFWLNSEYIRTLIPSD